MKFDQPAWVRCDRCGAYPKVGIFHTLSPVEHRISSGPDVFLPAIASGFSFSTLVTWSFALGAVAALAAIPAIAERFMIYNRGLVSWTRNLALLGYGTLTINEFTLLARWPALAGVYVESEAATRAAISAQPLLLLDPHGWLSFGAVGAFIIVVSTLALKHSAAPACWEACSSGSPWSGSSWKMSSSSPLLLVLAVRL